MKILIIEDESLSASKLQRMIAQCTPQNSVVGLCDSIVASVKWLKENDCDLIFLDVQLSDGLCFEIFRHVQPRAKIVITTAYDQYAIAAFKIGSVDYLLKPIEQGEFIVTMERIEPMLPLADVFLGTQNEQLVAASTLIEEQLAEDLVAQDCREDSAIDTRTAGHYKRRFTIRIGDKIIVIDIAEIAYFLSEDKFTTIVLKSGRKHISELTLDSIEMVIDPLSFFRITRGCIVNIEAIKSVSRYQASRLKVALNPALSENDPPLLVSRKRMPDFIRWLEG